MPLVELSPSLTCSRRPNPLNLQRLQVLNFSEILKPKKMAELQTKSHKKLHQLNEVNQQTVKQNRTIRPGTRGAATAVGGGTAAGPKLPTELTTKIPLNEKQHVRQVAPLFHKCCSLSVCAVTPRTTLSPSGAESALRHHKHFFILFISPRLCRY